MSVQRPIAIMLPMAFAALASFGNALRRVQSFLVEEDHPSRELVDEGTDLAVDVSCADLAWLGEEATVDELDLAGEVSPECSLCPALSRMACPFVSISFASRSVVAVIV